MADNSKHRILGSTSKPVILDSSIMGQHFFVVHYMYIIKVTSELRIYMLK